MTTIHAYTATQKVQSLDLSYQLCNPFKPEFTIVIFIHYKPRIAVAILDLPWMKMTWSGRQIEKNMLLLLKQFHDKKRCEMML